MAKKKAKERTVKTQTVEFYFIFWYIRYMKKANQQINIEIDKLTRSIENSITGDRFSTELILLQKSELKSITGKNGWLFNWDSEYKEPDRALYKLTISSNFSIIQGLISLTEKKDHVYMHLIESAPFNRGKNKVYLGVPGNLVAFACKISFNKGFEGYVSFRSKSDLIKHYEKILGAEHIGGQLMVINTFSAKSLVEIYFEG